MPMTPEDLPVMLAFDLDAETMWTSGDPKDVDWPILKQQSVAA